MTRDNFFNLWAATLTVYHVLKDYSIGVRLEKSDRGATLPLLDLRLS
jgi:hypothetical protein